MHVCSPPLTQHKKWGIEFSSFFVHEGGVANSNTLPTLYLRKLLRFNPVQDRSIDSSFFQEGESDVRAGRRIYQVSTGEGGRGAQERSHITGMVVIFHYLLLKELTLILSGTKSQQ